MIRNKRSFIHSEHIELHINISVKEPFHFCSNTGTLHVFCLRTNTYVILAGVYYMHVKAWPFSDGWLLRKYRYYVCMTNNSEADASESCQKYVNKMFLRYYMLSDLCNKFKSSITVLVLVILLSILEALYVVLLCIQYVLLLNII